MAEGLKNQLALLLVSRLIKDIGENEGIQEFFYNLGKDAGETIPYDIAEPEIASAMDQFKKGMLENK